LALHHDLLEQAAHLAARESKKPKQASLRRAVSAAYYALFHLLIADGARLLSPTNPAGLRVLIQRAFNHGDMNAVCRDFVKGKTSSAPLLALPLDPALVAVLDAFVELQAARHRADYDLNEQWNRLEAQNRVQTARQAFADWATVRNTPNAAVFVAALLLEKRWKR
jgi:hypothetical protein